MSTSIIGIMKLSSGKIINVQELPLPILKSLNEEL